MPNTSRCSPTSNRCQVHRIVDGSLQHLTAMYRPLLQTWGAAAAGVTYLGAGVWQQDVSRAQRASLLAALPAALLRGVGLRQGRHEYELAPLAAQAAARWVHASLLAESPYAQLLQAASPGVDAGGSPTQAAALGLGPASGAAAHAAGAVIRAGAAATGEPVVSYQSGAAAAALRADIAHSAVASGRYPELLHRSLSSIVWHSSARQAAAGVLMAGPLKSGAYLARKLAKAWR